MQKQLKILKALHEPLKQIAIRYYYFVNKYTVEHPAPIPSDDELWEKFMEFLANEEKLHKA